MKHYGGSNNLQYQDIEVPKPRAGEVLVEIKATVFNDWDWSLITGKPAVYRLMFGLFKPKHPIPGIELAGVVTALGEGVGKFKFGDRVFGDISDNGWGTFAEYGCYKEVDLIRIPENMSFMDAAAIPHAAMLAYQGLFDIGGLVKGQQVLINGAGGGMGAFAIQMAKLFDAEITGVDNEAKLDFMTAQGCDHVIDYRKQDITELNRQFDLILDAKTTRYPSKYLKILKPKGKYVTVGGHVKRLIQLFVLNKFGKNQLKMVGLKQNKDLEIVNDWYGKGNIKPVIDGPYTLEKVPELVDYFGEGRHRGKIIITNE